MIIVLGLLKAYLWLSYHPFWVLMIGVNVGLMIATVIVDAAEKPEEKDAWKWREVIFK